MTVTKKEMVVHIASQAKVKQGDVKKVIQRSLDYIIKALAEGKKVELRNFGVFKVKSRKSRMGRNPRTGEAVSVPPRKVVVFKPGLIMKRDVKQ